MAGSGGDRTRGLSAERALTITVAVEADVSVEAEAQHFLRLDPRLLEIQREVDSVRDDGVAPWFCSNFVWLPVNTRLRALIGVARDRRPGDEAHAELYDSRSYEIVFVFLSRKLPPCRECGCRRFDALRKSSA